MTIFTLKRIVFALVCLSLAPLWAEQPARPPMSAEELAGRLSAAVQGNAQIRTQLEIRWLNGGKRVLQLQIKQRRTKEANDLAYRVLWPNEFKDQTVLLHQDTGSAPSGSIILPHQSARPIEKMSDGLFQSDLSYQDAIENVYAWKAQATVGSETINGISCQILESKPDNTSVSTYGRVRTWVDLHRLVPLRIEKYAPSGELIRRIDITRVARDQGHQPIPAGLTVHGPRKDTVTEFNGVRIDQNVKFSDADFAPAAARP